MPTTMGISFFKSSLERELSYKARKSLACKTLAPSAVAFATYTLRASAHPDTKCLFYCIGCVKHFLMQCKKEQHGCPQASLRHHTVLFCIALYLELSSLCSFLDTNSNCNCHTNHWVVTGTDKTHHLNVCRN